MATEISSLNGKGFLSLLNDSEDELARIGGGTAESGALWLKNAGAHPVAYVGGSTRDDGLVVLYDSRGKELVTVGANPASEGGWAVFRDSTGNEAAKIGVGDDGQGILQINGENVKDFAEVFELASREGVQAGTVMAVTGRHGALSPSQLAYDPKVVGVVCGAGDLSPGIVLGQRTDGSRDLPIAIAGQAYVRVNTEGGPINLGDLLVASSVPGVAMLAADRSRAFGAVVGKALQKFQCEESRCEGLIRMLVMTR